MHGIDNMGCTILCVDSWSNAKSVKISSRMFSINIGNLHPASSYSLRVFASNVVGLSNPSAEIVFTTEEEGKTIPPCLNNSF